MLAMLFGCGFRRSELVGLELDEIQMRQGHWAVVDLIGKGGHIRTVPIPEWVKAALDQWTAAARVTEGRIFLQLCVLGSGLVHGNCKSSEQSSSVLLLRRSEVSRRKKSPSTLRMYQ
jgi:site-specific recombinase XerC